MPKVSVCLAVYKTDPSYLRECIESILDQTYSDFEFLIVDDCPEDKECEKIIKSYTDDRIKYYRNEKNLGISGTRNRLLGLATGEYIAVMDHDDISLPKRFEKQVAYLDAHPECGVVGSWYKKIPDGKIKKKKEHNGQIVRALKNSCSILHPASMIRKQIFDDNEIYYKGEYTPSEDYALWFDLIGKTKFYNLQEVLFEYRDHSHNASKEHAQQMIGLRQRILSENKEIHPELFGIKSRLKNLFNYQERKKERKTAKMYKKYADKRFEIPQKSEPITKVYNTEPDFNYQRGVIFASYNAEGKITEEVLFYLKNLKKYADFIIFVADNSVDESEMKKLENLANIAYFQQHGQYDFGSYKIGYNLALENSWLNKIEHLVFTNDSIIGPFGDLEEFFAKSDYADFYGLTGNIRGNLITQDKIYEIGCRHIQSYLFVLSKKFFLLPEFVSFINGVTHLSNKVEVIVSYEQGLSRLARKLGFKLETFLPFQKDITVQNWKEFLQKGFFIKKRIFKKFHKKDFIWLQNFASKYDVPMQMKQGDK